MPSSACSSASAEEDGIIIEHVKNNGPMRWADLAKRIPGKTGKQCRERWYNYLDPARRTGEWSQSEFKALLEGHRTHGSKWVDISKSIAGRTDNSIKNLWNSSVKVKVERYLLCTYGTERCMPDPFSSKYELQDEDIERLSVILSSPASVNYIYFMHNSASSSSSSSPRSAQVHTASQSSSENDASATTAGAEWTLEEDEKLRLSVSRTRGWNDVAGALEGRTAGECKKRWDEIIASTYSASSKEALDVFTAPQDSRIVDHVKTNGPMRWADLAKRIPGKTGKQCRERWYNHLDPARRTGEWTETEYRLILEGLRLHGSKWVDISKTIAGRNDNAIKNLWNSNMRGAVDLYIEAKKINHISSSTAQQVSHLSDEQIADIAAELVAKKTKRGARGRVEFSAPVAETAEEISPEAPSEPSRRAEMELSDIDMPMLTKPRKRKALNVDEVSQYIRRRS